jgi:hypothetical protein
MGHRLVAHHWMNFMRRNPFGQGARVGGSGNVNKPPSSQPTICITYRRVRYCNLNAARLQSVETDNWGTFLSWYRRETSFVKALIELWRAIHLVGHLTVISGSVGIVPILSELRRGPVMEAG